MSFNVYKFGSPENTLVFSGSPMAEDAPLAFRSTMLEAERAGYPVGTRFRLNDWYYCEVAE